MSPLLASWAADAVLGVHGLFIVWVVFGPLAEWRQRWQEGVTQ